MWRVSHYTAPTLPKRVYLLVLNVRILQPISSLIIMSHIFKLLHHWKWLNFSLNFNKQQHAFYENCLILLWRGTFSIIELAETHRRGFFSITLFRLSPMLVSVSIPAAIDSTSLVNCPGLLKLNLVAHSRTNMKDSHIRYATNGHSKNIFNVWHLLSLV